jgi:hypothetical protein
MSRVHRTPRFRHAQSGLSLVGLLGYVFFVAAAVFFLVNVLPVLVEYRSVRTTMQKVADSNPATVADARRMFDRQREVDVSMQSVSGNDIEVIKENGRVVMSVKYDKEMRILGPVSLLIHFETSTR